MAYSTLCICCRALKTYPIGDSDCQNANVIFVDVLHLVCQQMLINVWVAVSNENGNIWHVRTVSICNVKDFRSRESERTGCVCPSVEI